MVSTKKQIFKGLSEKAQILLSGAENLYVDFKLNVEGLEAEDLVAFSNSKNGGTILIGIEESTDEKGMQRGIIKGCPVGDPDKLHILNKANSCIPAVAIDIYIENTEDLPFYRIEIPPGKYPPYCTAKGTYTIRVDGGNQPLTPERLLTIFLTKEGEQFSDRFSQASKDIIYSLEELKKTLNDR